MNPDECSICIDPLSDMSMVRTECNHRFHFHCMRKFLRLIKEDPLDENGEPRYRCPLCRAQMSLEMVDNVLMEPRNLCFRYLLHRSLSGRPDTQIKLVVEEGSRHVESQVLKVENLPDHHEHAFQKVLIVDMELSVKDPRKKFRVWLRDVDTSNRISRYYFIGTTAIDHVSDGEEDEAEELIREPEQSSMPEESFRRRRVVIIPSAERRRRTARLERRVIASSGQIISARRAVERAQDILARRQIELQNAHDSYTEAMNEFISFRFPNEI